MATSLDKSVSVYGSMALLVGRILIGILFLMAAYAKMTGFAGSTAYFTRLGLPAPQVAAGLVLAFEAIAGVLLIVGWQTRCVALAVAAFCIVSALIAHRNFGDANQLNHFLKNFAIAGGCLALFVSGAGSMSVDGRK
jgi:putative oxidoreductase